MTTTTTTTTTTTNFGKKSRRGTFSNRVINKYSHGTIITTITTITIIITKKNNPSQVFRSLSQTTVYTTPVQIQNAVFKIQSICAVTFHMALVPLWQHPIHNTGKQVLALSNRGTCN